MGGAVRDLLLGRAVRDVDLVVEGDGLGFAERLGAELEARVRAHGRFGTATLTLSGGESVDVAGARRETYERPGALPVVAAAASIEEDLARRDFPINALALEVAPGRRLVDPFGGREDLARRRIRFLHPASPSDDPTRAFRAVLYGNRLGFRLNPSARSSIARAMETGALRNVSGDRIRRELARILEEPNRGPAIREIQRLGLASAVDVALGDDGAVARAAAAEMLAAGLEEVSWLCYFFAWMGPGGAAQVDGVANRLALAGRERRALFAWRDLREALRPGISRMPPADVSRVLRGRQTDELVGAAAELPAADRAAVVRAFRAARNARLSIRGRDLLAAGVTPGPSIGRALAGTLAAREEGRISRAQELEFAVKLAGETR